jgi:hypothetical protein
MIASFAACDASQATLLPGRLRLHRAPGCVSRRPGGQHAIAARPAVSVLAGAASPLTR